MRARPKGNTTKWNNPMATKRCSSIIKQKKKLQQQQQQQRPENRFPSSKRFDENFDCVLKEGEKEAAGGGRRAGARAEAGPRMWQTCFFRAATEGTGAGSGSGLSWGTGSRGVAPAPVPALSQGSARWKIVNIAKKAEEGSSLNWPAAASAPPHMPGRGHWGGGRGGGTEVSFRANTLRRRVWKIARKSLKRVLSPLAALLLLLLLRLLLRF